MIKSRIILKVSLLIFLLGLACFLISFRLNGPYFSQIAYDSIVSYELRQFAALILLFLIGFFVIWFSGISIPSVWTLLLSFPLGCAVWSFVSVVILISGVRYTIATTLLLMVVLLFIIIAALSVRPSKKNVRFYLYDHFRHFIQDPLFLPVVLILAAGALVCSAGFIYSFLSYDSFYYFINYGNALSSVGNFKDLMGDNTYTLTNIGQFLPMLCAYMSFWGIDQPYSLQAFLSFCIVLIFFYGLYELLPEGFVPTGKRLIYSTLFTLLLAVSTSFIIITGWMLANMYCMVYIFIAFLAMIMYKKQLWCEGLSFFIIIISFASLALIRKDGIIFSAFLFVCFICLNTGISKLKTLWLFIPSALTQLFWIAYVRLILEASVSQSAPQSIANNKNIFFTIAIIAAAGFYLFIHKLIVRLAGSISAKTPGAFHVNEYAILIAGLILLLFGAFAVKGETVIDNIDFTIRNMFLYPSSWGISGIVFGLLIVLSLIYRPSYDWYHFLWTGYAVLNLVSYSLVDSKALWVNWDDSYNRVLLQIVPVFVFTMALKIYPLINNESHGNNQ